MGPVSHHVEGYEARGAILRARRVLALLLRSVRSTSQAATLGRPGVHRLWPVIVAILLAGAPQALTRAARCRAATKAPRKPQPSGPTPAVANESRVRPHGDQRVPVSFVDPLDPPGALCRCASYSSNTSICCAR